MVAVIQSTMIEYAEMRDNVKSLLRVSNKRYQEYKVRIKNAS
jgi:hypothetical protein